jgi:hypothetical protein
MFAEPLKLTPLIVRAVWSVVAVEALPAMFIVEPDNRVAAAAAV